MRQASKRVPDSAEKTVRIFAEPHAGIIPLKRRSALCWKACAARTALLSCAARKGLGSFVSEAVLAYWPVFC